MFLQLIAALGIIVAANFAAFAVAYKIQSDKLTDISYSLSFVFLVIYVLYINPVLNHLGPVIISALILIWAIRLGSFLLVRISRMGHDKRFDEIRTNFRRFMRFFVLQGVAAWIIMLPAMIYVFAFDAGSVSSLSALEIAGIVIASAGLLIEVVADYQKSAFKKKESSQGVPFTGGLYSIVQYPNYSGEILFWCGIFMATSASFTGFQWLSVISPVFISALLIFVSGIPFLERGRKKTYGHLESYQNYCQEKKKLFPLIY
jgi:steroid 5-alpha reductase family enzyme